MKKILLFAALLLLASPGYATDTGIKSCDPRIISNNNYNAGPLQNCCCWHQGVIGCAPDGRRLCGDGTISPNCTCPAPSPFITYAPPQYPLAVDPQPNVTYGMCDEVFANDSCVIKRNP